jgi:hypothetical protein
MKRALVAIPLVLALLGFPGGAAGLCWSALPRPHCCCCHGDDAAHGARVASEGCGCRVERAPAEQPALPMGTASVDPGQQVASVVASLAGASAADFSASDTSLWPPGSAADPPQSYLTLCSFRC